MAIKRQRKPKPAAADRVEISYLTISPRGTITLPKRLRQNIEMVAVSRRQDGVIELRPKIAVDESQAWFWTERWQRMEREAEEDIKAGRIRRFNGVDALFKDLDS